MFFIFSEIYHVFFILFRAMPPTPAPSMLETLQSLLDDLPAELQRAARWVAARTP